MAFRKLETHIPGVWLVKPDVFGDSRGFFMELWNQKAFEGMNLGGLSLVQDNLSSSTIGTIRGLHFQAPPHAQAKLITVLQGSVLDVVVDIREDSPTFGQHLAVEVSSEDPCMVYVPEGMAHGFQVLSDTCLFFYKCTEFYHKASEGALAWNDPFLNISWREIPAIVSEKDQAAPQWEAFETPFSKTRTR